LHATFQRWFKEGGLRSADVSRLDLIVRWGGGRRLSGFLPVQSVYADIFVLDALWPDFEPQHLDATLLTPTTAEFTSILQSSASNRVTLKLSHASRPSPSN